jgi:hypothetical protein
MKWCSDTGVWQLFKTSWLSVGGTTPRNADFWAIHLDSVWLDRNWWFSFEFPRYLGLIIWKGENITRDWQVGYHSDQCKKCLSFCSKYFCTCKHLH